ncbi:MAG: hypothetical protein JXA37_04350 [Chloroflexia bacterium]|nr:hypothetical protein [Chloroflexia bacterium]
MARSKTFTLEELKPRYIESKERFNDWYFTAHFEHQGRPCLARLTITEGTLLGHGSHLSYCRQEPTIRQEADARVLEPTGDNVVIAGPGANFEASYKGDQVTIQMDDLTAICGPEQQRIIAQNERYEADLIYTPRGPILTWDHGEETPSHVTEIARVFGRESLSDVHGTLRIDGEKIAVQGRGLFEHVWFDALNFFEIRVMNWVYAHFDPLYLYICHCESVDSQGRPFHFETGEVYLTDDQELLISQSLEITPESWVYSPQVRRFIPLEQSITVKTGQGRLKLDAALSHYPLLPEEPTRLEHLTIDNIPGWNSLFYDAIISLEGKFTYPDGRSLDLRGGVGINEIIRIGPL